MELDVIRTLSNLSLFLQVIAFLMLVYAIKLKTEGIDQHARGASLAVFTIIPTILFMFYSISQGFQLASYGIVLLLHRLLGSIVLIFIILFVTNRWRFKKKVHMDIATGLWMVTLIMGIIVYLISFGYIA
ncbi:hypothetical protein [Methanococcoides sp. AM1]|uniref:hypothetical protein n=1 Tax=Methanococcoides sp. AM1 TaxID=1201011 RepID=UPI001082A86E|nr:hypothetical protein [Methanococcoides sp. AM1]